MMVWTKLRQINKQFSKQKMTQFLLLILIINLLTMGFTSTCVAQESNLINQYSPILYFEQHEQLFPVDINYHVQRAHLLRFTGDDPVEISSDITVNDLSNYSTSQEAALYLDNQIGSIDDNEIIKDYQNQISELGYTVYYHIIEESQGPTILQYWFFYAFNNGDLNQHEGDWEVIQIVLESEQPTMVMYSQHHAGQKASWSQIDKTDTHPHVYVARGSHANYFKSYQGTLGGASDHVGANGFMLKSENYQLVNLESESWITFKGRWGEINSYEDEYLGRSGPNGPMDRENGMIWNQPLNWGNNLAMLDGTILMLEWVVYHFVTIFVVIFIITLAFFVYKRMKQYKTDGFGPRYLSFLYIDGLNMKSIGNILFILGIIVAVIALFLPWYEISASSSSSIYDTGGIIDILTIDGINGIAITLPGSTGTVPLGAAMIPFSILIGIGIIMTLVKTLGVKESKILGRSYLYQGIKLLTPVILIIVVLIIISMILPTMIPSEAQGTPISLIFEDIAGSPFGGSTIKTLTEAQGTIQVNWGVQIGGILLLIAGILLIISGYIERRVSESFY